MLNQGRCLVWTVAGIALLATVASAAGDASLWDRGKLDYPPLREVRLPQVDRHVLPNGLVIYILADRDFPVVQGRILVRAGSMLDSEEKAGLASIAGTVLRTGGSAKFPGDDLDKRLEAIGASVEFELGMTEGSGSFWCLEENTSEVLTILADLLRRPSFAEEKLDLAKAEMHRAVASRNDEPMDIIFREGGRLVWGPRHPYGFRPEHETINRLQRQDLVEFHQRHFFPDRIYLTLWGDFETQEILTQITALFGDWSPAGTAAPPRPAAPAIVPGGGLAFAQKTGMTNAWVFVGHLGIQADNEDFAAMNVLGEILGGSFASRLFNEIRTKRGLAYAAGGNPGTDFPRPGIFSGYAGTRTDSALVVLGLIRREIGRITEEPVTEAELKKAKDTILNSYVFRFASKGQIAARMAYLDFNGYPADFTATYPEKVRKLTVQDLRAAARRNIHPDDLQMLVLGNEKEFAQPLSSLGRPYQLIDLTIPEPAVEIETVEATPASLEEGRKLLAAAAKATGGAAWSSVKSISTDFHGGWKVADQEIIFTGRTVRALQGRAYVNQKLPFGELVMAVTDSVGWRKIASSPILDLTPQEIAQLREEAARDLWSLFSKKESYQAQALEPEELEGKACDVLRIKGGGLSQTLLFLDRSTKMPVALRYPGKSSTGEPAMVTEVFSDFRPVGGVKIPHTTRTLHDGQLAITRTADQVVINADIPPVLFERPRP